VVLYFNIKKTVKRYLAVKEGIEEVDFEDFEFE